MSARPIPLVQQHVAQRLVRPHRVVVLRHLSLTPTGVGHAARLVITAGGERLACGFGLLHPSHHGAGQQFRDFAASRIIKREWPEVRVIGLSMNKNDDTAWKMVDAGAEAYLPKGGPAAALIATIRGEAVANGA